MDAPGFEREVEGDRLAVEAQEGQPQIARPGSPVGDIAVEGAGLGLRHDRGAALALPAGGLDPKRVVEEALEVFGTVVHRDRDGAELLELTPAPAQVLAKVLGEALFVLGPCATDWDVRRACDHALMRAHAAIAGLAAELLEQVVVVFEKADLEALRDALEQRLGELAMSWPVGAEDAVEGRVPVGGGVEEPSRRS